MSLRRIGKHVFTENKWFIGLYLANTALLTLYFYLYGTLTAFVYPFVLSTFLLIIALMIQAYKSYRFYIKFDAATNGIETFTNTATIADEVLTKMTDVHQEYRKIVFTMHTKQEERAMLFSQWLHNMKVSIAIIQLASAKGTPEALADIQRENDKLQHTLEECLQMLRLADFSRDYVPERVQVKELVQKMLNEQKSHFIYAGIFPSVQISEDLYVYTDLKWCKYLLGQLITNAIKYSKREQTISIQASKQRECILLHVQDDGIGIAKEDITRVFEPFFTGKNGRHTTTSSGIGLFMAQQIAQELHHELTVQSTEGQGSTFTLTFLSIPKDNVREMHL